MVTIQEYISNHLTQRAADCHSLVVYDQEKRYRDIVSDIANEECTVIDASQSTILGREQALNTWRKMAVGSDIKQLIIYLPYKQPVRDEEKQQNRYVANKRPFHNWAGGK